MVNFTIVWEVDYYDSEKKFFVDELDGYPNLDALLEHLEENSMDHEPEIETPTGLGDFNIEYIRILDEDGNEVKKGRTRAIIKPKKENSPAALTGAKPFIQTRRRCVFLECLHLLEGKRAEGAKIFRWKTRRRREKIGCLSPLPPQNLDTT